MGLDKLGSFSMDKQRRCYKGPCHDVFFREAPWGASARRSRHPSSRFSRDTVSWRPSPSLMGGVLSNHLAVREHWH